jgi:NAD(P)-dependent dehydrogenase (short-subunit alcohol dehydrogenase family)
MRFEGKGVLVTGAAQGIGRAVAKAFAAEGAGLVLLDNEGPVLDVTAQAMLDTGAKVEAIVGDVR